MKLVLWSGGLDSTAILLYFLKENIPFETLYISLENNEKKVKEELLARRKILKALQDYYGVKITDRTINVPSVKFKKNLAVQPILWLFGMVQCTHENIKNICLGYVRKDDFWYIKHSFERAYYHLNCLDIDGRNFPSLYYPFEWYDREDLVDKYYLDDIGSCIFPMIWVCENPDEKNIPCKKCSPCVRFKGVHKYFKKKVKKYGK